MKFINNKYAKNDGYRCQIAAGNRKGSGRVKANRHAGYSVAGFSVTRRPPVRL